MKEDNKKESIQQVPEKMEKQPKDTFLGIKIDRVKSMLILRSIALNVVSIILIAITFFIGGTLRSKAEGVREARSQLIVAQESSDFAVLQLEIENSSSEIEEIRSKFIANAGLLEFISAMDVLKAEGTINEYRFSSNDAVADSTGNRGFPIQLDIQGDTQAIDRSISRMATLPFLVRPVNIEISKSDGGLNIVRYGVFVYVAENFNQN